MTPAELINFFLESRLKNRRIGVRMSADGQSIEDQNKIFVLLEFRIRRHCCDQIVRERFVADIDYNLP